MIENIRNVSISFYWNIMHLLL